MTDELDQNALEHGSMMPAKSSIADDQKIILDALLEKHWGSQENFERAVAQRLVKRRRARKREHLENQMADWRRRGLVQYGGNSWAGVLSSPNNQAHPQPGAAVVERNQNNQ